jgi:hypothetical protein
VDAAKLAKEAASMAVEMAAEGNKSFRHIDEVLLGRTDLIKYTVDGVQ